MIKDLPKLNVPDNVNYFAAFVSMSCSLHCSYCINDLEQANRRDKLYPMSNKKSHIGLSPQQWITALNRFPKNHSLPITLCGGEATLFYGLNELVAGTDQYFDLLTNMTNMKFFKLLGDNVWKFQRNSPYPTIRVSWHEQEMNRVWKGRGFEELVSRCEELKNYGFDIHPNMYVSDSAIYMVNHPSNSAVPEHLWQGRVPFETKEFLGLLDNGDLCGTYKYPHSTDLIASGYYHRPLTCNCFTGEAIVDPMGFVWSCHHHLYSCWSTGGLVKEFASMLMHDFRFKEYEQDIFQGWLRPLGHLLDPEFSFEVLSHPKVCHSYGECSPCDTKLKSGHHKEGEEYSRHATYASVTISDIQWPSDFDHSKQPRKSIPIKQL